MEPETRSQELPSLADVLAARRRVYSHMQASPLLRHPLLTPWVGTDVWVKHENHNPTGAFKIRGGLNLVARLGDEERRRGVISASTGNHGQSIAFASQVHGIRCRIVVPVGSNAGKMAGMRASGAEVVEHGRDFDEAREYVEALAAREGWRYVHSANEPHLIAGIGTMALELFEALPDADYVFVPVGGGSGAAACCLVRSALGARARIIGVQAEQADAFARSWRGPTRVTADRIATFAEGVATRVTFDLTFPILKAELEDVVTLSEEELEEGMRAAIAWTHNLSEASGAAPLAAAHKYRARLAGRKVVCVMSGGNADPATLRRVLAAPVA
jgi:threonine dehydratase